MSIRRLIVVLALAVPLWLGAAASAPAATSMQSIFQDDPHLMADPAGTLTQMRMVGATVVKVAMRWDQVSPNPRQRNMEPEKMSSSDFTMAPNVPCFGSKGHMTRISMSDSERVRFRARGLVRAMPGTTGQVNLLF